MPPVNIRDLCVPPCAEALHVRAFCATLSSLKPVRVRIRHSADALPLNAFKNVENKVVNEGGRGCFGWRIKEWPRVYIEASYHAVYEPPDGSAMVDLTPALEMESSEARMSRLFLRAESQVFDFSAVLSGRGAVRRPLTDDPEVLEFLRCSSELAEGLRMPPQYRGDTQPSLKRFEVLRFRLAMRYTPAGAPCFCGGGAKFKRCHGSAVRRAA